MLLRQTANAILTADELNDNWDLLEGSLGAVGPYVVSGLVPSIGTGLSVNVTAGSAFISVLHTISAFVISGLTPSNLNHLYWVESTGGTSNTSGTQPANSVKLGTATTGVSTVTAVDTSVASGRQQKGVYPANVVLLAANNAGKLGIGIVPVHPLDVNEPVAGSATVTYAAQAVDSVRTYFTDNTAPASGCRGWHIQKKSTSVIPVGIILEYDTVPLWDVCAIDATTKDLVPAYDHTANAGAGADIIRLSQEVDSTVSATAKVVIGRVAGTPNAQTTFLLIDGGDDTTALGGVRVRHFGGTTINGLELLQRSGSHNRSMMAFGDTSEVMWLLGTDVAAANNKHLFVRDNVNAKNRLYVANDSALNAKFGVGTTNPAGMVAVTGSTDSSLFNTRQVYLALTHGDNVGNRGIIAETIVDTGPLSKQFLWLNGHMGSTSTYTTPNASSDSTEAHGFRSTDDGMSWIVAPSGSNQAISTVINVHYSGAPQLSFFAAALAGQQSITGSRGGNAALADLLTKLATIGLIVDGTSA